MTSIKPCRHAVGILYSKCTWI